MRKLKQLLSFVIVLALMVSLSTGAFAASYTAASYRQPLPTTAARMSIST